ncbi:MAG: c-type cytochrome domain-containing protein [Bryobacterales bacterium]
MRPLLLIPALLLAVPAFAVDFANDIEPIFHERCFVCHGPSNQMSGFRLDQQEAALKGGYSGAVIVPGDAAASKLIERVTSEKRTSRCRPPGLR